MSFNNFPPERRVFHYRYKARYRQTLKERAYKLLGNACSCGSTDNLRIRFRDSASPLKALSQHPETLHNRILRDPEAAAQAALMCHTCRVRASVANGAK